MRSDLGRERVAVGRLAGHEEDGVLAGDRPGDHRVARLVHGLRERARIAGRRDDDEQVPARLAFEGPALERGAELVAAARVGGAGRRVHEVAGRVAHLHEPELVDVPRDGRLDDVVARIVERGDELALGRERALADEAQDLAVPFASVHAASTSARIARPPSASSVVSVSGGASLSTSGPALRTTRPASRQAERTGAAGRSSTAPISRPAPRTSTTPCIPRSPSASRAPVARTPSSSSSVIASQTAPAAAQATGLPPKVEPWSPATKPSGASSETRRQPIGRPLASAFASVTRCGRTPTCSKAKKEPVRPVPVWISSRQSSAPSSAARASAAWRNAGSSGITPPSPRIGSSRLSPMSGAAAGSSEITSFGCATRTPWSSGSKAARFAGWPVADSEPLVRPWKLPSSAITPVRPVALRAYFRAASFASAPELQKKPRAPPNRSDRRRASSSAGSVPKRLDACQSRSSWA